MSDAVAVSPVMVEAAPLPVVNGTMSLGLFMSRTEFTLNPGRELEFILSSTLAISLSNRISISCSAPVIFFVTVAAIGKPLLLKSDIPVMV